MENYGIHWFRRDLRIAGNENLRHNWKQHQGRVLGIFCFDSVFLSRPDFSHNRFAFFLKTLSVLKEELQAQGGDLLVVDEQPHLAFPKILTYLKNKKMKLPSLISYGADYEPFARSRDEKVAQIISEFGVELQSERDHLLIEPWEILKDDGGFYQVYTPFSKRWFEKLKTPLIQSRLQQQTQAESYYRRLVQGKLEKIFQMNWTDVSGKDFPYNDRLQFFIEENNKAVTIPVPEAGFRVAYDRLKKFSNIVDSYKEQRDFPELDGTSQMSLYQKNGSLVSSQILQFLNLGQTQLTDSKGSENRLQFVKEIAWREFYYSIIYHKPQSEKQSFNPLYQNIKWQNNELWFQRWCEGQTGFPIVDAGMRQLNATGWMHNRVRMIVASFLVKDLLISWQWGENYFMKMLLDGDIAPNNGGWQWAASTGCDAQPYFRVFNPWLQSAKFDPEAHYIKHFVPELRDLSAAQIHDPEASRCVNGYPAPMVQHSVQKEKAIALFKK